MQYIDIDYLSYFIKAGKIFLVIYYRQQWWLKYCYIKKLTKNRCTASYRRYAIRVRRTHFKLFDDPVGVRFLIV